MKFIDSAKIYLKSGDGGMGCVSFHRAKFLEFGGPDGGNGGKGGDIYFVSKNSYNTLIDFRYKQHFKAQRGGNGAGKNRTGNNGEDLIIEVPIGTIIYNEDKTEVIHDFTKPEEKILICQSGIGGRGNASFKSSTNRAPTYAQKGTEGQEKWVWLELEILADVGIIGLPNAGKSSLIGAITNSKSKVGNYPFTTLMPNLGVLTYNDEQIVIADLPGIIEHANEGIGLGTRFLSHIKRCKAFIHMLDASDENVIKNYKTIRKELIEYDQDIENKIEIIALNKIDLLNLEDLEEIKKQLQEITSNKIRCISVLNKIDLHCIIDEIISVYSQLNHKENQQNISSWKPY